MAVCLDSSGAVDNKPEPALCRDVGMWEWQCGPLGNKPESALCMESRGAVGNKPELALWTGCSMDH